MSQPNSAEESAQGVEEQPTLVDQQPTPQELPTQKQKTSVYTVMLIISFICIVVACVLLYQELTLWGNYPWWKTDEGKPNVSYRVPATRTSDLA